MVYSAGHPGRCRYRYGRGDAGAPADMEIPLEKEKKKRKNERLQRRPRAAQIKKYFLQALKLLSMDSHGQ